MRRLVLTLLLLLAPATALAAYTSSSDAVTLSSPVTDDAFLSGTNVSISSSVLGDLFAAASNITHTGTATRSAYLAGENVTVSGSVGWNLFAAGSSVSVGSSVAHDAYLAGQAVTTTAASVIDGQLRVAASTATIEGTVAGDAWIGAETAVIRGTFGGDLTIEATTIDLSGATVTGTVRWTSPNEPNTTGATLGGIEKVAKAPQPTGSDLLSWITGVLSALLLGALVFGLFRRFTLSTTEVVRSAYGTSLAWGLLAQLVVIPAAILALITLVGAKIALLIGAAFVLALLLAGVTANYLIGNQVLRWLGRPAHDGWMVLLIGVLVAQSVIALPVLGWLFGLALYVLVLLPSFGAILSTLWKQRQ